MHHANLVNFGILPLVISDEVYEQMKQGDKLVLVGLKETLTQGVANLRQVGAEANLAARHQMTPRQVEIYSRGGLLNYVRDSHPV